MRWHFIHVCVSVPSKAVCREIGPALRNIGSTDFDRISKKVLFLDNLADF